MSMRLNITPPPSALSKGSCLSINHFTEMDRGEERREAIEVCLSCPVLELCRSWTATMPRPRGIVQAGRWWPLIGRIKADRQDEAPVGTDQRVA
jgi:hypothetical protein